MNIRLQIIGGGNMGEALVSGLMANHWASEKEIHISEPFSERQKYLKTAFSGISCSEELISGVDTLIAVKPDKVLEVLKLLLDLRIPRVLSIAAGVKISTIEKVLGSDVKVIRAMPNTPALIGQGAAGVAPGSQAKEEDLSWAIRILSAVGLALVVSESQLDAVTGISGSGPAYLFLLAEALIEAGCEIGLSRDDSKALVEQTLLGSASLLMDSADSPEVLRKKVTSKGGTTAAAITVFEKANFRSIVLDAVTSAKERSKELGD